MKELSAYLFGLLFCILPVPVCAEMWLAKIEALDTNTREVSVEYLNSSLERPEILRVVPSVLSELRVGMTARLHITQYEGVWWLDRWWPVSDQAAQVLREGGWLSQVGERLSGDAPFLGLDEKGGLADLNAERFRLGCLIVPYVSSQQKEDGPLFLEKTKALAERLETTPHRDLPIVLWSLEPEQDDVLRIRQWQERFQDLTADVYWVSGFTDWQEFWESRFSVVVFQVEGQVPVTNPLVVALDGDGREIMRYEGSNWPFDWIVRELDEALLSSSR